MRSSFSITTVKAKSRRRLGHWLLCLTCVLAVQLSGAASAADLNRVEGFDDGDHGWQGDNPTVIESGGPEGDGDAYLDVKAVGGNGPGSRLAVFNSSESWIGDFSEVGTVEMDVRNPVESGQDLSLRLVLMGPDTFDNRWTSIEPEILASDGMWHHVSFPVDVSNLISVQGDSTYDAMLSDVVRILVRHDAAPAGAGGDRIVATLGIDNMVLRPVPEPGSHLLFLLGIVVLRLRRQ